jgi:hypothetical protein
MRKLLTAAATISLLSFNVASVFAEPSDTGQCRQDAHDVFVAASTEGTMGDFMSDVIFGNEPNELPDGTTVPSQSPGPFVNTGPNEPPRDDHVFGFTGGDLQELVHTACN